MAKKAIIAGASGLIGSHLLQQLLDGDVYDQVLVLTRRPLPVQHPKLEQLVIDFDQLDKYADQFTGDAVFSCLGTTVGQTPDKILYRKIDHDYPIRLAQLALKNGVRQFHWVSSVGADAASSNAYLKLKGETEDDLKKAGIPSLHIYRPSMLTGRKEKLRFSESAINAIMKLVDPLLMGSLTKYHSIPGSIVAKAMISQSIDNQTGIFTYQYNELKKYK
ncbi:oxidoreductase [Mucilaginibacter mali]|uniref:Oxidoreductase n=1 Tax=Mucilaginibacter mali TaxID=2740462 RepID=A0A7D4ULV1_9SPHI|nr:oxidoreductase [Mucilaginibacter mali]QKJ32262.1 oxidoreductase [Mucilaginibacter mali]